MKDISPTKKVKVGNSRIQNAYNENIILNIIKTITSHFLGKITVSTLDDWLSLPVAGETDLSGNIILGVDRDDS